LFPLKFPDIFSFCRYNPSQSNRGMEGGEGMRGAHTFSREAFFGFVLYVLATLVMRVEDGQFEREYSRLYAGLVGFIGLILLVVMAAVVGGLIRRLTRGARDA
jgi:hypothetical protein